MAIWMIILVLGIPSTLADNGCSVTCGVGVNGSNELCNQQPCPGECDKCALTNGVGYLPDTFDCNCYYQCVPVKADHHGMYSWKVVHQCCPNCLNWDAASCTCDYPCCDDCTTGAITLINGAEVVGVYNRNKGSFRNQLDVACDAVCVSEGSDWRVKDMNNATFHFDADQCVGYTGAAVQFVRKTYIASIGPWDPWSSWGECYPWCDKHGNASLTGEKRQRRGRPVTNWCDRECPCEEKNATCETPDDFVCPTTFTRDPCPVVFWLEFMGNTDDRFGSAVMPAVGKVGFSDKIPPPCAGESAGNVQSGEFDGDMLQVPYFNNWFDEPNDRAFAVSLWFKTSRYYSHMLRNGCRKEDGTHCAPAIHLLLRNLTLTVELRVYDGPQRICKCEIPNMPRNTWNFAAVLFNGDRLRLLGGDGCEHECNEPCQGRLVNNKCDLFIGHHNDPNHENAVFRGLMDEVKVYTTGEEVHVTDECCPCPP